MITIINYGLGNVTAFYNVYKYNNIPVNIGNNVNDFNCTTGLILPGVGAFDWAVDKFTKSNIFAAVENLVLSNNIPILGVCVGMQMLGNKSEEGKTKGLGWIEGEVVKFPYNKENRNYKIPHMGWNTVRITDRANILDTANESEFYFLHSYYFKTYSEKHNLGYSNYVTEFASIINDNNIYGVQFHPEKSHNTGVKLLKNFYHKIVCTDHV